MKKALRKPMKRVADQMVTAYWGEHSGVAIVCGYNF